MKNIYCVRCAKVTPHSGYIDHNNEAVYECTAVMVPDPKDETKEVSHSFVKFPKVETLEELNQMIASHEEVNSALGKQMEDTRKMQSILKESLADGTQVEVSSTETPAV